jgi:putative sterol carrier protein
MATTSDPTGAFLEDLASRGHDPLLHQAAGTLRIDLLEESGGEERWYVTMSKGDIRVGRRPVKADAVMRAERALVDGMVTGKVNATAALLRGVLEVEGDLGLVTMFSRLLPGPARSKRTFLERQKELNA